MSDTDFRNTKYQALLQQFGRTISATSKGGKNNTPMIDCQYICHSHTLVCFDDYAKWVIGTKLSENLTKKLVKSCDALLRKSDTQWFLIEFKSGRIGKKEIHEIRGKVFESLLILTEELETTIHFTRKNVFFVLVHDETKSHDSRIYFRTIQKHLATKAGITFQFFNLSKLKGVYFQDVFVVSPQEFNTKVNS